jgi:hypothetical protein
VSGDTSRPDRLSETENLLSVLQEQIKEEYAPPRVKRDAHPKMHGCVQGELIVEHDVPGQLRHGVFAKPDANFKAWIRFSNAFGIQHDLQFQPRGMAIKLIGVEGDKLSDDEKGTQDFLLVTHDAFFLAAGDGYVELARALAADPPQVMRFFTQRKLWRGLLQMLRSSIVLARSPLAVRYFSQTPYRLGEQAEVKLQARPVVTDELARALPAAWWFSCEAIAANVKLLFNQRRADRPAAEQWCDRHLDSRDLLRRAMMEFLARHDARFDLMVQVRTNLPKMPIEDATRSWPQRLSPFVKVATLRVPRQLFWPKPDLPREVLEATIEMMDLGENMSFNPWHSLLAHEPLGAINQMRRRIYPGISGLRHLLNQVLPVEPDDRQYERLKAIVQDGQLLRIVTEPREGSLSRR